MAVIDLSPAAVDIIMASVDRIDNFDPKYYPIAENIAEYVNATLPPGEKVTMDDINMASIVIARKYPELLGPDIDEVMVINTLIEAFINSLASRISGSSIGKLAIIFIITFFGYTLIFGGGKK